MRILVYINENYGTVTRRIENHMVQFCSRPTLVEILRGMEGVLVERVLDIPATSSNSGHGWRLIVPFSLFLFFTFNISSSPLFKKTSSVLFAAGLTRPPPIPFKINRGSNRSCPSTSRRNPILMVIKKKKKRKKYFSRERKERRSFKKASRMMAL